MDSNQWMTQEMNNGGMRGVAMGEMASSSGGERKLARPQKDKVVNCPRCNSTNTKFCYYNNYSLTQPRYFCKSCRRYWTEGGTLRNVPVGGGSRKHKRSTSLNGGNPSSSSSSSSSSAKLMISNIPDLNPPNMNNYGGNGNPSLDQGQDLNLGGYRHFELPKFNQQSTSSTTSALELLRTGVLGAGPNSSNGFMSMSMGSDNNAIYASNNSGFSFQELKPAAAAGGLSFSSSVHNLGGSGNINGENGGRMMMFPFGGMSNMKQVSIPSSTTITTTANHHNHEVDHHDDQNRGMQQVNPNGFWNSGGGSW